MSDEPDHVADALVTPAVDSPADQEPPIGRRTSRPRNYLERGERRRLLWRFMPVALAVLAGLTVVEQIWFKRATPATARQVDTSLEAVRGPHPSGETVLIEPEPEPAPITADELSADPGALARVRDDTFFREADLDAWLQTWITLRDAGAAGLAKTRPPRVSFGELFGQPRSFRGRLVRFRGTLHRVEHLSAPQNNYNIEGYWQGWLEPAGGPASPIVVHFLELPPGMPTGMKISEPVDVTGYFFKRYAYNAADTIRVAPLVMAIAPAWKPVAPVSPGGTSLGTWALVTMTGLVAATVAGMWLANRDAGRRPVPAPVDLATALGEFEQFSTSEALRRLAGEAESAESPEATSR